MSRTTSTLAGVCGELAYWLPRAAALVAEHDTTATSGRAQPDSKPPWNADAATAVYDALEAIRRAEQQIRQEVTGRPVKYAYLPSERRPHAKTGHLLESIPRLAEALDDHGAAYAIELKRCLNAICALNSIGETEPWRRIIGASCPYCGHRTLLAALTSGRVTCPRFGECKDGNGNHPSGVLDHGAASARPLIAWADGTTQHPGEAA